MAALLVAIAVLMVMMSVAMPVWRHDAQREKEAELVWRGNQYVRAIRLFQAKTGSLPTSVDMLVQQRFLRKKFLDPITNGEFTYIGAGSVASQPGGGPVQAMPGAPQSGASSAISVQMPPGGAAGSSPSTMTSSISITPATASSVPGGLIGVQSKSKDESIMEFNGRTHYNEWVFLYAGQNPGGLGGRGAPGALGGRGGPGAPGGRGGPGGTQNGQGGRGRGGPGGPGFRGAPDSPPNGNPFPFQVPPGGRGRSGGH